MRSRISRCPWQKAAAALAALGLHAAVLAMVLSSPVAQVAQGQPEALEVQFVELTPAAEPAEASAAVEEVTKAEEPPALPVNQTFAPEPQPKDESEPESQPQAVSKRPPEPNPKPKPGPKPASVHRPHPAQPPSSAPDRKATPLRKAPSSPQATGQSQPAPASQGQQRAVDPDRPRTVGQVDYLGKRPTPVYPRLSERRGEQGRVMLRVLISPQGRVADVTVQRSSGYARLDEAAVQAMRQARFRPYTENGVAYPARVDIPFDFVL